MPSDPKFTLKFVGSTEIDMAVLTPDIAELLGGPVMMLITVPSDGGWPLVARGLGGRARGPYVLDVMFSGSRYPLLADALSHRRRMAVTVARVTDYVSRQIKGEAAARPADIEDAASIDAYRQRITTLFESAGTRNDIIQQWIGGAALHTATLDVSEVYDQTPGPGAGRALGLAPWM